MLAPTAASTYLNMDIRTSIKRLSISPTLKRALCCYRCFALYPLETEETHCSWRDVPDGRTCGEALWRLRWGGANAPKPVPRRLFTYQTMQSWLEFMLSLPSFENLIDSSHLEQSNEAVICTDVRESCMWQELGDYTSRSGNLVFAFYIDWFNPFTNKMAGKKVSMGVIILACLNLPPEMRYKSEYLFMAGITPGPREPSVVTINNILQPLVDELERLDAGITITTPKHPEGRAVRVRIGPVIADLVALRKVTGFAAHSARLFCSFCKLPRAAMASSEPQTWVRRSHPEVMKASAAWKSARTLVRRENLFKRNGVRFSLLHRLSYRDSVKHNVIGIMHNWLEGVLQHHMRERWGFDLSRSMKIKSKDARTGQDRVASRIRHQGEDVGVSDWESELRDLREDRDLHNDEPANDSRLPRPSGDSRHTRRNVDLYFADTNDSDYCPSSGDVSDVVHSGSDGVSASIASTAGSPAQADLRATPSIFDEQAITDIRAAISDTFLPTWLDRPPTNLGEASHGKLKADTYFVLFTTILPLHLVECWTALPRKAEMLDNFCDLVTCTNIACGYSTTRAGSRKFEEHYRSYSKSSIDLFPLCRSVPNHHYAYHIPDQLLYWGPLMRLSEFAFERQNGLLQGFKTNSHLSERLEIRRSNHS